MLMKLSTISRLASAAVVTGISTVAFATPAHAMVPDPPGYGSDGSTSSSSGSTISDNGTNWSLLGAEAATGVAILGAGAAGFVLVRRHNHHTHLPHAA
jgi:hypothetical protein